MKGSLNWYDIYVPLVAPQDLRKELGNDKVESEGKTDSKSEGKSDHKEERDVSNTAKTAKIQGNFASDAPDFVILKQLYYNV